jgi:RND family efflux transporter MFP subunit
MHFFRRLTILIISSVLVCLTSCEKPVEERQSVRTVRAIKVGDVEAFVRRSFPGRAKATQEVNLSYRISGPLITLPVNVGDMVEEGDVLSRIDPRDFEVKLRNIQAQLQDAEAQQAVDENEYERAQSAHERGGVSDIELARDLAERDRARAQVQVLEASVRAAQDALEDTNLTAPFKGQIVAKYVENFEDVQAKQAILRLLDDSKIEMIIDIPEHLIMNAPYVRDGYVVFDAFPDREIHATIKEIGTEASSTTRTYPVTLIMDQPEDIRILPGMTGEASAKSPPPNVQEFQGAEVPVAAVIADDNEVSFVWVIDESSGRVTRRDIELGETTARGVLINGVEIGEIVAVAGAHYLREGQIVKVMDEATQEDAS